MALKRSSGQSSAPPKKRGKSVVPVAEKLDLLVNYLKDEESCDVPGTCSNREMLQLVLPYTIGIGAASDERFRYQDKMVGLISDILEASVAKWQARVTDAQAGIDATEEDKASAEDIFQECQREIDAAQVAIKECKDKIKGDGEMEKEAEKDVSKAQAKVDNFDGEQAKKVCVRDDIASLYNESFCALKMGKCPSAREANKCLKKVTALLHTLPTDKSLFGALPDALTKAPADRGEFDEMVVTQCDNIISRRLSSLADDLMNSDALKTECMAELHNVESKLDASKHQRDTNNNALKAAEEYLKKSQESQVASKKNVELTKTAVSEACKAHERDKLKLARATEALDAFSCLRDRRTDVNREKPKSDQKSTPGRQVEPSEMFLFGA